MSEPTTLYILITPVLKANKVLGRIAAFVRFAQPRTRHGNLTKSVHRERWQCPNERLRTTAEA